MGTSRLIWCFCLWLVSATAAGDDLGAPALRILFACGSTGIEFLDDLPNKATDPLPSRNVLLYGNAATEPRSFYRRGARAVDYHYLRQEVYALMGTKGSFDSRLVRLSTRTHLGKPGNIPKRCGRDHSCLDNQTIAVIEILPSTCQGMDGDFSKLRVDWVHDTLYWTCQTSMTKVEAFIMKASLFGDNVAKVASFRNGISATEIELDPLEQKLFWLQRNYTHDHKLKSMSLDGGQVKTLKKFVGKGTKRLLPSLCVDLSKKRIFYAYDHLKGGHWSSMIVAEMDYEGKAYKEYTSDGCLPGFFTRMLNSRMYWPVSSFFFHLAQCSVPEHEVVLFPLSSECRYARESWRLYHPEAQPPHCPSHGCPDTCHYTDNHSVITVECDFSPDNTGASGVDATSEETLDSSEQRIHNFIMKILGAHH